MARASNTLGGDGEPAGDPAAEAEFYLERVRALAPRIEAAAEEIDRERRIPAALHRGLLEAGFFRLFLPRSLGGAEAHPLTFMRIVEAIAGLEASTAWNIGQNAVCGLVGAYLSPEVGRKIFGDERAVLAWGPPEPDARAVVCDGGYRVTGAWSFASGARDATWLGGYCPIHEADGTPRRAENGATVRRVMLFPAEAATMTDVWHVIGLRGTASDAYAVSDLLVPHDHSVLRDDLSENREPGWLYRFTVLNLFACGFSSIALAVARSMLESLIRLAAEKTPRGSRTTLRDNAATQAEVAQAEARLASARSYLVQSMTEICAEVQRTLQLTLEQRMTIRLAATHAIQQAVQVGDFAYEAAGSGAIFASNPFERRFRDLHAIAQQLQGRKSHFQTVGKFLLGLDGDFPFV